MKPLEIEVYCPIYLKKRTVYCYRLPNDQILSNGCDDLHGDPACKECCKKTSEIAKKELSVSPDTLFH